MFLEFYLGNTFRTTLNNFYTAIYVDGNKHAILSIANNSTVSIQGYPRHGTVYIQLTSLHVHVHCRYTDDDVHSHARDINSLQLFLHTVVEIWTKVDDALKEKYVTRLMFHILKACCSRMLY